jgi:hypothetical protein
MHKCKNSQLPLQSNCLWGRLLLLWLHWREENGNQASEINFICIAVTTLSFFMENLNVVIHRRGSKAACEASSSWTCSRPTVLSSLKISTSIVDGPWSAPGVFWLHYDIYVCPESSYCIFMSKWLTFLAWYAVKNLLLCSWSLCNSHRGKPVHILPVNMNKHLS